MLKEREEDFLRSLEQRHRGTAPSNPSYPRFGLPPKPQDLGMVTGFIHVKV